MTGTCDLAFFLRPFLWGHGATCPPAVRTCPQRPSSPQMSPGLLASVCLACSYLSAAFIPISRTGVSPRHPHLLAAASLTEGV